MLVNLFHEASSMACASETSPSMLRRTTSRAWELVQVGEGSRMTDFHAMTRGTAEKETMTCDYLSWN
jgi:hypothetical protein